MPPFAPPDPVIPVVPDPALTLPVVDPDAFAVFSPAPDSDDDDDDDAPLIDSLGSRRYAGDQIWKILLPSRVQNNRLASWKKFSPVLMVL